MQMILKLFMNKVWKLQEEENYSKLQENINFNETDLFNLLAYVFFKEFIELSIFDSLYLQNVFNIC